jgi:hypothetical protein
MLELRPSIVTQAQFDELSEMKVKWEEKKKIEEKNNLEKILISNNLLNDENDLLKKPSSDRVEINQVEVQVDSNSQNDLSKIYIFYISYIFNI